MRQPRRRPVAAVGRRRAGHRRDQGDGARTARTATTRSRRDHVINYAVEPCVQRQRYGVQSGSTFKPFTAGGRADDGLPSTPTSSRRQRAELQRLPGLQGRPASGPSTLATDSVGHVDDGVRHRVLGQHLLRRARGARSGSAGHAIAEALGIHGVRGKPSRQVPSFTLGSADHLAAVDGRGVRDLRGPRRALRPASRSPRSTPSATAAPGAPGDCSAGHRPGHRRRVNELLDGRHRRLRVSAAHRAARPLGGRPAAGKTGTTNDSVAVWFVGYTPAARHRGVGRQPAPRRKYPLQQRHHQRPLLRRGAAARCLARADLAGVMRDILAGVPSGRSACQTPTAAWTAPDPPSRTLDQHDSVDALGRILEEAGFIAQISTTPIDSIVGTDRVAATDPARAARQLSAPSSSTCRPAGPERLRPAKPDSLTATATATVYGNGNGGPPTPRRRPYRRLRLRPVATRDKPDPGTPDPEATPPPLSGPAQTWRAAAP